MKVIDLIKALAALPVEARDFDIILASDEEGNSYSKLTIDNINLSSDQHAIILYPDSETTVDFYDILDNQ